MNDKKEYGEAGCLGNASMIGKEASRAIQRAINNNNAVGTIIGYYDDGLTILSVSDFMLHNLGYSYDEFQKCTGGSLKSVFYGENTSFLDADNFRQIRDLGEGEMLTHDGTPVTVRIYKEDSVDRNGTPIWIMSARLDWEHENVTLINGAMKSGMWYLDFDDDGNLREVYWSHAFRKMLGYHDIIDFPNEISSWSDLIHPVDKNRVLDSLKAAITDSTNEYKYDVEYRLRIHDGQYHWFRTKSEIIRRTDGTARRITGTFVNIDAEKEQEMQRKKAAAFHNAFTKTNLCEYYVNLEENTFDSMKVESSLLTIFESSGTWDELIAVFIDNYVCEEYRHEVARFYDRRYIARRLEECDGELSLECRIMINGEKRWTRNVILRGDMEQSQYAIIFLRDITAAKREAEIHKQMSEDNEAMGHLLHSVTRLVDHFAICDLENDTYEYFMINIRSDYPPEGRYSDFVRLLGNRYKTLAPLAPMTEMLKPENLRKHLTKAEDVYKFEYCNQAEDCYRSSSFVPLEWKKGVLTRVLWVSMDISQEKKQEIESRKALKDAYQAAERANRAKTEFLTNMSHDIRTPMNAIVGLTAIAGANIDCPDKVLECLGKTTRASRHLLGLVNEVLDMARIESGRISLAEEEFNLSELVDNLISMAKSEMNEHHHSLEVNIKNIEHEDVYGDTLRIQQVFMNLMNNSIKYTPDGGHIVFSIEERSNGQSELGCYVFSIEDDGIGMDENFQKIMFQPFTRADDNRTTKIQGTGLGMAITQNIVNMMNGNIQVES